MCANSCNLNYKLLLDYDGVVFNNPRAMKLVSNRSAQFVANKLDMSFTNARMVNSTRYKVHGHTVNYLNHIGVDTTLEEYNDFVFGKIDWNLIDLSICEDDYNRIINVQLLNQYQNQKSILFTNAPYIWVERTLEKIGTNPHVLFEDIYTCENSVDMLKPNKNIYEHIESNYPETDLLFIDDGYLNVQGLGENWRTHLFRKDDDLYFAGRELVDCRNYNYI